MPDHEVTTADAALMRMIARAKLGEDEQVILPSGNAITGAQLRRWLKDNPLEM